MEGRTPLQSAVCVTLLLGAWRPACQFSGSRVSLEEWGRVPVLGSDRRQVRPDAASGLGGTQLKAAYDHAESDRTAAHTQWKAKSQSRQKELRNGGTLTAPDGYARRE
eukprot:4306405-Prymnesium_polylepis.1